MFYPRWEIDPAVWWQYLLPAAAIVLFLVAWWSRRRYRWLWAGLLFFLLTLIPFLGFFSVRMFRFQFVAEHFEYLPIIGIIVPLSAGVTMTLSRWHGWKRVTGQSVVAIVLAALTIQTWQHSAAFRDAETCYRDSIANGGENWAVDESLALILVGRGQFSEAERYFRKALDLKPPDISAVGGLHLNLGQVLRQKGQPDEALEEFRKGINAWPDFRAFDSLASVLLQRGRMGEAIANCRKSMELEPNSPVALANAAWILATAADESLRNGSEALELSLRANNLSGGTDPFTLHALAAAYAEKGKYPEAIETAKRGLRIATEC